MYPEYPGTGRTSPYSQGPSLASTIILGTSGAAALAYYGRQNRLQTASDIRRGRATRPDGLKGLVSGANDFFVSMGRGAHRLGSNFRSRMSNWAFNPEAVARAASAKLDNFAHETESVLLSNNKMGMRSFHRSRSQTLNEIDAFLENPRGLGAKLPWYRMTAKQHLVAAPRSGLKLGIQSLPVIGGIWGVIEMTSAAVMPGNPFKNYVSNLSSTVGVGVGARVGAAVGTAILPGIGTAVGGVIGAVAGGFAGGFAGGAIFELPGAIAKFGRSTRNTAFNGSFMDSEGAATMRQASLQAIRNTELNNRNFILGNEAGRLLGY